MAVTPDRYSRLIVDSTEELLVRPSFDLTRGANAISAVNTLTLESIGVSYAPGNAWILDFPHKVGDTALTSIEDIAQAVSNLELATGWQIENTYRKPSDLVGVNTSGFRDTALPVIRRTVDVSSSDWNQELDASAASLEKPDLISPIHPILRVAAGNTTYTPNKPFIFTYSNPASNVPADVITRFYFGGDTITIPSRKAGKFCLECLQDNQANLYELSNTGWVFRKKFEWNALKLDQNDNSLRFTTIRIIPYANDTLAFYFNSVSFLSTLDTGSPSKIRANAKQAFYRHSTATGFQKLAWMTGPGTVEIDAASHIKTGIGLYSLGPPVDGLLVDTSFWIPYPMPIGTPLAVVTNTFLPKNTKVVPHLYDATTGDILTESGGLFYTINGSQLYRAVFEFKSDEPVEDGDPPRSQTPVLYGYNVSISAAGGTRAGTNIAIAPNSYRVTGPDIEPSMENASIDVQDPKGLLGILRTRGRVKAELRIYNGAGTHLTTAFDGEIDDVNATWMWHGSEYPGINWWHYDLNMKGMWERISRVINLDLVFFDEDPTAPIDPFTGKRLPWKITDIVAYLLQKCGFYANRRIIPDDSVRLFPSGENNFDTDLVLQPTIKPAEMCVRLLRDYLHAYLIWDPNALSTGAWRVLYQPRPGGSSLVEFVIGHIPGNRLAMRTARGATQVEITDGTYRLNPIPPEGNYVLVYGVGALLPEADEVTLTAAYLYNPVSFDFVGATSNPSHPDYLGHFTPIVVVDSTLRSREACAFLARRIYDVACHAQYIIKFNAPAVLITPAMSGDPNQTRDRYLRIGDKVLLNGTQMFVRSVSLETEETDAMQMADYELQTYTV